MTRDHDIDSLDSIVESLVRWAGMGTLIIDHMSRCAPHAPPGSSIEASFRTVVRSSLHGLEDRHAATDLRAAAAVMADVVETAGEEILLVEPDNAEGAP